MRISDWSSDVCSSDLAHCPRRAAGRQHMVGAAAIVAQRLGRPVAQEHRAGRLYAIEPCARLAQRQDQVLGGVAVADLERGGQRVDLRSEEHTSELQSLMRISYAVFCLKKKKK